MNNTDIVVTVLTVGVVQVLTMAFGFGALFQRVKDHGARLDRLEEHEDDDRNRQVVWTGPKRRTITGHL